MVLGGACRKDGGGQSGFGGATGGTRCGMAEAKGFKPNTWRRLGGGNSHPPNTDSSGPNALVDSHKWES